MHVASSSPPAPLSAMRFWFYTLGLLLVWTIVITQGAPATATNNSNALGYAPQLGKKELELQNAQSCKALCAHCSGKAFYCGEECICECNDENSDTECIATMQKNARLMNIPFEILIQGPNRNRFVRNAMQFEQSVERKQEALNELNINRNKRSTVVIYKPAAQNMLQAGMPAKTVGIKKNEAVGVVRHKRSAASNSQLEWFTDLANTLVRPAPLKKKSAQQAAAIEESKNAKRENMDLDRSWFTDGISGLVRPAPMRKRGGSSSNSGSSSSDKEEPLLERSRQLVENFPQFLKETIRNMQDKDSRAVAMRKAKESSMEEQVMPERNRKMVEKFPHLLKKSLWNLQEKEKSAAMRKVKQSSEQQQQEEDETEPLFERSRKIIEKLPQLVQESLRNIQLKERANAKRNTANSNEQEEPLFERSRRLVEKLPQLVKESLRNIKDKEEPALSLEHYGRVVEKLPEMLKETLRNIHQSAFVDDFTDVLRLGAKDAVDVYRNRVQDDSLAHMGENMRDGVKEILDNMRDQLFAMSPQAKIPEPTPRTEAPPQFVVPWTRPARFLRRVQDALKETPK